MKNLGTAAQVTAELESKVAAEPVVARTKKPAETAEGEKKPAKVKVSDVIIKLIADASYLKAEQKTQLLGEIDKILAKVTNSKPSLKNEIRELIFAAGEVGITRDGIYAALCAAHTDQSPMDIAVALYTTLQPVNYQVNGKFGWTVKPVGKNYVWVK